MKQLIHREIESGIDPQRIILGGFSQGACMTLWTGFTLAAPVGGLIALSGYLPRGKDWLAATTPEALATPLLQCHGTSDLVVSLRFGRAAHAAVEAAGASAARFETFPGAYARNAVVFDCGDSRVVEYSSRFAVCACASVSFTHHTQIHPLFLFSAYKSTLHMRRDGALVYTCGNGNDSRIYCGYSEQERKVNFISRSVCMCVM